MDDRGGVARIDQLTDSNFHVLKQKVQLVLALRELDDYIVDDPPDQSDTDSFKSWSRADRKARALIGLSLSDEHLEHVRDAATAKEIVVQCATNVWVCRSTETLQTMAHERTHKDPPGVRVLAFSLNTLRCSSPKVAKG